MNTSSCSSPPCLGGTHSGQRYYFVKKEEEEDEEELISSVSSRVDRPSLSLLFVLDDRKCFFSSFGSRHSASPLPLERPNLLSSDLS